MFYTQIFQGFNPLSPNDALKHHINSLKADLIYLQPRAIEWKFQRNWLTNTFQFSSSFQPLQIIFIHYKSRMNCDSNSRLVVDEDDNVKFRLDHVERVKGYRASELGHISNIQKVSA